MASTPERWELEVGRIANATRNISPRVRAKNACKLYRFLGQKNLKENSETKLDRRAADG
jgi:hypothetical protein